MKLPKISIRFGEKTKPDISEMGATGNGAFSGAIDTGEWNPDLVGTRGIQTFSKMRRDGSVKAGLLAYKLPLQSATWGMEPASDSPKDKEVAEFVENNLKYGMSITFDEFLRHALMMLDFGFSAFEKVWEVRDGQYCWQKLAPRLQKTIIDWKLDDGGGLASITQYTQKGTEYKEIPIPVEKLLVFTNEKEGSNFLGKSLLESAYPHWYFKRNLYRIDAMAAEKNGLGTPIFKHPASISPDSEKKLDKMGQGFHAHERMYFKMAEGYDMQILGVNGAVRDIMPSIEHHDTLILRSILAHFLKLGSGDTGSWALSQDQSSFFLMALRSVSQNFCDTMNRHAIKQLVDYNFQVDAYPTMTCSNLETRQTEKLAEAVSKFVLSGCLTPDEGIEKTVRELLKLPAKEEAAEQKERKHSEGAAKPKRELKDAEKFVAFSDIDKRLDDAVGEFVKAAQVVQKKQIDKLTEVATKIISKHQLDKVDDIDVPFRADMAAAIQGVLETLCDYGRENVRKEMTAQLKATRRHAEMPIDPHVINPADLKWIKEFLSSRAKATANIMATKLKSSVTWESLRQMKANIVDSAALLDKMKELSDRELQASAQFSVSEAFNFGRGAEAEKFKEDIDRAIYSAILDNNTCVSCRAHDGQEYQMDDPQVATFASGNPGCYGGGACRCMLVYVAKSETK